MLTSVWRVGAINFNVENFIHTYSIKNIEKVFIQGQKDKKGNVNDTSGFNALISEKLNPLENVADIEKFIDSHVGALHFLMDKNFNSCIDISCTVGTEDQFVMYVKLPSALLGLLNQYNIELEFSAYPACNDEE